jgi:hypothetical protein
MAQRKSGYKRKSRDLYQTPRWVTRVILPYIPSGSVIWEPACATGKMSKVLKSAVNTDLVTNYGRSGVDFLSTDGYSYPNINAIVTNPPYSKLGEKFIRHALKLMKKRRGFVAMLLPVDFDSAKTRRDVFAGHPAFLGKIVLTTRIVWFKGGKYTPSSNHAWFLWDWKKSPKNLPYLMHHERG